MTLIVYNIVYFMPPSLIISDACAKSYSMEYQAFPAMWLCVAKFWPTKGVFF